MAAHRLFRVAFLQVFLAVWILDLFLGCEGTSLGGAWKQKDGTEQGNAELVDYDVRIKRQAPSNVTVMNPTAVPEPGTGVTTDTPDMTLLDYIMEQGTVWPFWVVFGATGGVVVIFLAVFICRVATRKEETAEERMKRIQMQKQLDSNSYI
ncbi:PREDICTED: uncharacterized protein LOC109462599 isoform X2 [Branchiostoma belcheri]|uniref:Uncharacterized protein LOC109462599 isoform X2 n=1 Tax=Branchiostoma belcheri TaxID=7741 RepID=A0A6P4XRL4_BRABE|nr:PREDICTED: uncharacterized protein LOC109462599 isoform X2 [Branchiostoma belcheri]